MTFDVVVRSMSCTDLEPPGATTPEWMLRYCYFLGDLVLQVDGVDFSTDWGWVPVWDAALSFRAILTSIRPGESRQFEFTESEAIVRFDRSDHDVWVTSSYALGRARVALVDFQVAANSLVNQMRSQLASDWPALVNNPSFADVKR